MKQINILYVTTRQWNPGDEFILAGARQIIAHLGLQPKTESIYNKSPEVTTLFDRLNFWKRDYIRSRLSLLDFALNITHYDNSFKAGHNLDFYDYVVFAGSPGWFGGRLHSLYKKLDHFKGKILFLGIGLPNKKLSLSALEQRVLKKSIIFCRNPELSTALNDMSIEAQFLPCPALLSAPDHRQQTPQAIKNIGMVFVARDTHRNQSVSPERYELQNRVYKTVLDHYQGGIICHYSDEIDDATRLFGAENIHYRYDALDYIHSDIYTQFDYVISTRVHGNGVASSLSIPNLAIAHDKRGGTVDGFLSEKISSKTDILDLLKQHDQKLAVLSANLKAHKEKVLHDYLNALRPALGLTEQKTEIEEQALSKHATAIH